MKKLLALLMALLVLVGCTNGGNGGNSGKHEIDFDDLIGAGNGNTEPSSGKDATEPDETKPSTTEPESTEPEATTPGTTAPDSDEDKGGGALPQPGDIDVSLQPQE